MNPALTSGLIVGLLSAASALSIAFKHPALGAFFSDPGTATIATAVAAGIGSFVAGILKGWHVDESAPKAPQVAKLLVILGLLPIGAALVIIASLSGAKADVVHPRSVTTESAMKLAFANKMKGTVKLSILTPTDLSNAISTVLQKLKAKGVDDLTKADTIAIGSGTAANPDDALGHACYPALIKYINALPVVTSTNLSDLGIFQLLEYKRIGIQTLKQGLPTYVVLGCAPLLQSEEQILIQLGASVGLSIAIPSNLLTMFFPSLTMNEHFDGGTVMFRRRPALA